MPDSSEIPSFGAEAQDSTGRKEKLIRMAANRSANRRQKLWTIVNRPLGSEIPKPAAERAAWRLKLGTDPQALAKDFEAESNIWGPMRAALRVLRYSERMLKED